MRLEESRKSELRRSTREWGGASEEGRLTEGGEQLWDRERGKKSRKSKLETVEVTEFMVMGWIIGVTEFMVKGWVAAGEWRSLEPRN